MPERPRLEQRKRKNSHDSRAGDDSFQRWRTQLLTRLRAAATGDDDHDDAHSGHFLTLPGAELVNGGFPQTQRPSRGQTALLLSHKTSGTGTSTEYTGAVTLRSVPTRVPATGTSVSALAVGDALYPRLTDTLPAYLEEGLVQSQRAGGKFGAGGNTDRRVGLSSQLGRPLRRLASACRWTLLGAAGLAALILLTRLAAMAWGGIVAGSLLFVVLTLVSWFVVGMIWRKNADVYAIARLTVFMSGFCMWFMWIMCYMDQMNPIIRPIRKV